MPFGVRASEETCPGIESYLHVVVVVVCGGGGEGSCFVEEEIGKGGVGGRDGGEGSSGVCVRPSRVE